VIPDSGTIPIGNPESGICRPSRILGERTPGFTQGMGGRANPLISPSIDEFRVPGADRIVIRKFVFLYFL